MTLTDLTRCATELAERQWGVVALWQLLAAGLSRQQVRTLRNRGLLRTVHRGVYEVGWSPRTREATFMAAALAAGPTGRLFGTSAGTHFGVRKDVWLPVHVVAERLRGTKLDGIERHRHLVDPADRHVHRGVPVTSLPLTLIDCAGMLDDLELRRTIERVPAIDARTMRRCLDRYPGRPGRARIDDVLRAYEDRTRSYLEREFLKLCRQHGLPKPAVNQGIEGKERDFSWPDRRLIVETDGHAFHLTREQRAEDNARDLSARKAGWTVQRFTYEAVVLTPAQTAADVQDLLRVSPVRA